MNLDVSDTVPVVHAIHQDNEESSNGNNPRRWLVIAGVVVLVVAVGVGFYYFGFAAGAAAAEAAAAEGAGEVAVVAAVC